MSKFYGGCPEPPDYDPPPPPPPPPPGKTCSQLNQEISDYVTLLKGTSKAGSVIISGYEADRSQGYSYESFRIGTKYAGFGTKLALLGAKRIIPYSEVHSYLSAYGCPAGEDHYFKWIMYGHTEYGYLAEASVRTECSGHPLPFQNWVPEGRGLKRDFVTDPFDGIASSTNLGASATQFQAVGSYGVTIETFNNGKLSAPERWVMTPSYRIEYSGSTVGFSWKASFGKWLAFASDGNDMQFFLASEGKVWSISAPYNYYGKNQIALSERYCIVVTDMNTGDGFKVHVIELRSLKPLVTWYFPCPDYFSHVRFGHGGLFVLHDMFYDQDTRISAVVDVRKGRLGNFFIYSTAFSGAKWLHYDWWYLQAPKPPGSDPECNGRYYVKLDQFPEEPIVIGSVNARCGLLKESIQGQELAPEVSLTEISNHGLVWGTGYVDRYFDYEGEKHPPKTCGSLIIDDMTPDPENKSPGRLIWKSYTAG